MRSMKIKRIADNKFYALLLAIAGITNLIMLITFEYCDLDSMTAWTFDFWDLFFQGRLDEFYRYAALQTHGAFHVNCGGNYLWLLPWCIWNLPLWIVHSLSGVVLVTNFWSLCWSKLYLLLFQWVLAHYTAKICALFITQKTRLMLVYLLVFASPEVMMSVGYAGQDEIVYMALFVAGLYYALCGQKKKTYLMMVITVSFCPIMILPVIMLFILMEKNIPKIIISVCGTVVPLLLFEAAYQNSMAYQGAKALNDFWAMIQSMLMGTAVLGRIENISIGGVLLVLLYFFCYQIKTDSDDFKHKVIYAQTAVFLIICFLMTVEYYRLFLYVPLLVILIVISGQNERVNLFLLAVLTYGRAFIACATNRPQNMNTGYVMKNSWVTRLCDWAGSSKYVEGRSLYEYWLSAERMETLFTIVISSTVACMIILFVINYPGFKKKYDVEIAPRLSIAAYCACMPMVLLVFFVTLL